MRAAFIAARYFSTWRLGGADNCPARRALDGQHVAKITPPLHKGCQCYVVRGETYKVPETKEAGEWGNANFPSAFIAAAHEKHLTEFYGISYNEYVELGWELLNAEPNEGILEYQEQSERYCKYDVATNVMVIANSRGITTIFKPKDAIRYWKEHIVHETI